jgi:hypothetical protein
MTPTPYNAKRKGSNRPRGSADARELVTIPRARATGESELAIWCDFGDGIQHPVPKSQIASQSDVKRRGDSGRLIVGKWWAEKASVMKFARAHNVWDLLPRTRYRFEELNRLLAKDDPVRGILKVIADTLRTDLGFASDARTGGTAMIAGQVLGGGGGVGGRENA